MSVYSQSSLGQFLHPTVWCNTVIYCTAPQNVQIHSRQRMGLFSSHGRTSLAHYEDVAILGYYTLGYREGSSVSYTVGTGPVWHFGHSHGRIVLSGRTLTSCVSVTWVTLLELKHSQLRVVVTNSPTACAPKMNPVSEAILTSASWQVFLMTQLSG